MPRMPSSLVFSAFFTASALLRLLLPSSSSTLPSAVQCDHEGCTLSNYQGVWVDRTPCKASQVVFPTTESELLAAVAQAVKGNMKVKAVTENSYSTSKIACPGGQRGLLISMRDYSHNPVAVNKTAMTATVDAGVELRDFVKQLAEHGLTIPHTPLWNGVSIGGVISTGSHGSGFYMKGAVISEYVIGLRMVLPAPRGSGYAKVVELTSKDEALQAAKISLGVLGVISKVTFAVMPMFKRSLTVDLDDDEDLEHRLIGFSTAHAFPSLFWIPSTGKVILKQEDAVSIDMKGEGVNMFPLLQPMRVSQAEAMRAHHESIEKSRDTVSLCKWGEQMVQYRMKSGDSYLNAEGEPFEGFPVVGFNHRMQTVGGCQVSPQHMETPAPTLEMVTENSSDWRTCKWDTRIDGVFYYHTAVSIPLSRAADFIRDVKRLRQANPHGMCSLNMFGGIHVRFLPKSEAYLGDREDAAMFEMLYFRARQRGQPRLNEDVMEELEQMMVRKHGGKPHWGKNREVAFEGVGEKVVDMAKFVKVKEEMDPGGLFSSEWSDELLGIKERVDAEDVNCAMEGLCVCREHRHCAPEAGYLCQPGLVYPQARVCRYIPPPPPLQPPPSPSPQFPNLTSATTPSQLPSIALPQFSAQPTFSSTPDCSRQA